MSCSAPNMKSRVGTSSCARLVRRRIARCGASTGYRIRLCSKGVIYRGKCWKHYKRAKTGRHDRIRSRRPFFNCFYIGCGSSVGSPRRHGRQRILCNLDIHGAGRHGLFRRSRHRSRRIPAPYRRFFGFQRFCPGSHAVFDPGRRRFAHHRPDEGLAGRTRSCNPL